MFWSPTPHRLSGYPGQSHQAARVPSVTEQGNVALDLKACRRARVLAAPREEQRWRADPRTPQESELLLSAQWP
eukprot:5698078-Alexandrium_andersonii.AAC.1